MASKKKLVDKIRVHFGWVKRPKFIDYYPLKKSLQMASKFKTLAQWEKSEHYILSKNKAFIMNVMGWSKKYTYETCLKSSKKFKTPNEWFYGARKFYDAAMQFGHFDKVCKANNWKFKYKQTNTKVLTAAFNTKSINTLKKKDADAFIRIKTCGWEKSLFQLTNKMKQEITSLDLNSIGSVKALTDKLRKKENIFPVTPALKSKLLKGFCEGLV